MNSLAPASPTLTSTYKRVGPGAYGFEGEEIIITPEICIPQPRDIACAVQNPNNRILAMPDPPLNKNTALLKDLDLFINPDGRATRFNVMEFRLNFANAKILEDSLRGGLAERFRHYNPEFPEPSFDALREDIGINVHRLSHVFNMDAPLEFVFTWSAWPSLDVHTDFGVDQKRKRGVRSPTNNGSLFAEESKIRTLNAGRQYIHSFTENPVHAGAGLVVLAGNAVHSSYPTRELRPVYTIDGKTLG